MTRVEVNEHRLEFALSAFLVALVATALPIQYEVNDDFGVQSMLLGADGFKLPGRVPFLSFWMNLILPQLYELNATIPWYGLLLFTNLLLAWTLMLVVLSRTSQGGLQYTILLIPWLILGTRCIYLATMTSSALLLQFSATLVVLLNVRSGRPIVRSPFLFGCFLLAYLWRWKISLYCLLFLAPVALFTSPAQLRRFVPYAIAFLFLVLVDRGFDQIRYSTKADQAFESFSRARVKFHDSPAGQAPRTTEAAISAANWTELDFRMFRYKWILYDEERFNEASINQFLREVQSARPSWHQLLWGEVRRIYGQNQAVLKLVLICGLALLVLYYSVFNSENSIRTIAFLTLTLLFFAAVAAYRMVPRVSVPMAVYILGAITICGHRASQSQLNRSIRIATLILCGVGCLLGFIHQQNELADLHRSNLERRFISRSLSRFSRYLPPKPVCLRMEPGYGLNHRAASPLSNERNSSLVRCLPAGWLIESPRYHRILAALGYSSGSDILQRIGQRDLLLIHFAKDEAHRSATQTMWQQYLNSRFPTPKPRRWREVIRSTEPQYGWTLSIYRVKEGG